VKSNSSQTAPTEPTTKIETLLESWDGPYGGTPPWDSVNPEQFEAAFKTAIELENADLQEIVDQAQALDRLESIYHVHTGNLNVGPMADIEARIEPLLSAQHDTESYKSFVRQGALLDAERKKELSRINVELASLFTRFSQNVLAAEQKSISLDNKDQLKGLSEEIVQSMELQDDSAQGKWSIANTRSAIEPVLTYAELR